MQNILQAIVDKMKILFISFKNCWILTFYRMSLVTPALLINNTINSKNGFLNNHKISFSKTRKTKYHSLKYKENVVIQNDIWTYSASLSDFLSLVNLSQTEIICSRNICISEIWICNHFLCYMCTTQKDRPRRHRKALEGRTQQQLLVLLLQSPLFSLPPCRCLFITL